MPSNQKVAVVIPVYKNEIGLDEQLSLEQYNKVLGHYPVILCAPEGLDLNTYLSIVPQAYVKRFAEHYFRDIAGYNRMMLSSFFYDAFREYKYILIYQLDAFVFNDTLEAWCNKGYDYVGAPWIEHQWAEDCARYSDALRRLLTHHIQPRFPIPASLSTLLNNRVGNGGLSLRHVKTFRRALHIWSHVACRYNDNEDQFWSFLIPSIMPGYRIAPLQEALKFAFDTEPRTAFEMNNHEVPFGCHAWRKYDADFWRPIFLRYGHTI